MNYKIDEKLIIDGKITIHGWVIPDDFTDDINFTIVNSENSIVNSDIIRIKRNDVARSYLSIEEDIYNLGFNIEFDVAFDNDETYYLIIKSKNDEIKEKINRQIITDFKSAHKNFLSKLLSSINANTIKNATSFLKKNGLHEFIKKIKTKLKAVDNEYAYQEWYKLTKTNNKEIERQYADIDFKIKPRFSIVIPIYDTEEKYLFLLFKSLLNQTYRNFEICIADATNYSNTKNNPKLFFEKLIKKDDPYQINNHNFNFDDLHIVYLNENKTIADNTNAAISMATGDYIVLSDHDDELTLDALYEVAKAINNNPNAKFIYSDEDKVDKCDDYYFDPNFKSDFNLDMLLSVNYICHLSVVRKDVLDELYKIDGAYELSLYNGAQDYNLYLRIVNYIINNTYNNGQYDTSSIIHIKKVLYHWRWHEKSTSKNVSSKLYAFENGSKAIEDFYKKTKIDFPDVLKVENGYDYGIYHTIYSKNYNEPLISVIIPNKDHIDDLNLAINSIKNGNYKNIEFIICENNSNNSDTFKYYESLNNIDNIKIVNYKGSFNYSKINNYASTFASGDYLLFLNNDVEMIEKDSIHEMLSYIKRSDVGAVGAKLLYKDNTYQHAGVVIGIGGIADNIFKSISIYDHTYMNRAEMVVDYSAVTAACLMTKKTVFDKINGFDEKLAVAFNDIDLCLKIREQNYIIVYNPYSSFYHYESKSRGYEDTKEKIDRFNHEFAYFVKKWETVLKTTDIYYNPNLTLRQNNFSLKNLNYEKIGSPYPIPKEIYDIIKNELNN